MRRPAALLLVAAAATAVTPLGRAQTPDDPRALIDRAAAYVEAFQQSFGSMVAQERYEQDIRQAAGSTTRNTRGGGGPERTVLVSDFLLVQVPGQGWLPFRDVFERDGKRVRDREERLAKLFLSGGDASFEQAKKIMDEGARYNIGNVQRNINAPTLPLPFLTTFRDRFAFSIGKREDDGVVLQYRETGRPTFIATTGGRDLPVQGRFWVDAETGAVRKTELIAIDTGVEARITVTYQLDEGAKLWVPAKMEERYRRARDSNEVRGTATYTKFRRFQVNTETSEATEANPQADTPPESGPPGDPAQGDAVK